MMARHDETRDTVSSRAIGFFFVVVQSCNDCAYIVNTDSKCFDVILV